MDADEELTSLEQLLDRMGAAGQDEKRVSFGEILDEVGCRSYGPPLLLAGLLAVAPIIGDIPGMPTLIGVMVLLIAVQLLFHREHIWLPEFLLNRSFAREKLQKALSWLRPPARFVDRLVRPRLRILTDGWLIYVIVFVCLGIAATMPVMEFVPFTANAAGAALAAYGLALMARDGLLALIAFAFTGLTVWSIFRLL